MEILKFGALDNGFKFFTPQGEAESWELLSHFMAPCQGRVYGESMSQPVLLISMWLYFSYGFLLGGIPLCAAVDLVCPWEEVSSGASYVSILNRNPLYRVPVP